MMRHELVLVVLLSLLLWTSCTRAQDSAGAAEEEKEEAAEEPKKEKTTEIEEENDVMVLHIYNFDRALSENTFLLVEFYAPWCSHCKGLEPVYAKAAKKLKKRGAGVRLAKVDATEEKELAEEFDVEGFPTLKLFVNGDRKKPVKYTGKRTVAGITRWMESRSGPGALTLTSVEAAAQYIDAHNVTVVGFFDSLESEAAETLREISLAMTDTQFGLTAAPEVLKKYKVKANSVVLFKKFDDGRADFVLPEDGKLEKSNVTTFIKENRLELIITYREETSDQIFNSNIRLHSLLFINTTVQSQKDLLARSRAVAKEFKGKILFIVIDMTTAASPLLEYFGVLKKDAPTTRLIDMDSRKKFAITSGHLTADSLRQLCQEVLAGTAKTYFISEEIPEDWDQKPVKVLVGKNFQAVALDPEKNVFVKFYAPWCAHCKDLIPIWDQLGEKYADHGDIIIAKMDSTVNEAESLSINRFPTIKYFPAGGKEVIDYTGKTDLETFSKFLDNGGVLPEKKSDDDEEDDDGDKEEADAKETDEGSKDQTSKDEL